MKNNYILFDFDGVIADSFQPAFEVNKMMCPHLTEDQYRRRFEGNINDWEKVDEKHTDQCRHDIKFFDEYIPKMKNQVTVVPEMAKVIGDLAKLYNLIIVSSTITSPIQDFMEKYNLPAYFTEIMGNDVHRSKVEKIKMIFTKYSVTPKECVFITDTLGDIREATQTQVGAIGVSWGFHAHKTLVSGNPFRIVDKPEDLEIAVADYFASTK
ncbi:MAG: phosphoglycolate phosphatase, phosphoglycolate phosphatase [Parcubacteria group bacterium GW2011_GWC1_39_29]|uniref:Putative phosphatase n=1 Tax=Candidatus Yanofskybacteria bacterium GW2011_GWD1_39_16 TaxID=1619030 RepID=A0A837HZJ8_9BACT|nr:MAG: putative phosphatase [Candidatus Yanofskybacteria bacterium GW2011_GWD1_39_16]KKR14440.1 MAG: phosphoglycolate phosphatase, phosphoglycolate phosphatase [Parcubacteria group bacterium GW2011_GWC1_39_29]